MKRWVASGLFACAAFVHAAPLATDDIARLQARADAGEVRAAFDLGRMYRNGIAVARDSRKAYLLIEAAARKRHAPAMFILSNMLAAGEGTAPDEAGARQWLEDAAELEYPEAMQQLALHLRGGALGFVPDEARSAQLVRKMAHAMKHRHQH